MANIKLKDGSGIEQTYSGVTKLSLPTAEGSTVIFSEGSGETDIFPLQTVEGFEDYTDYYPFAKGLVQLSPAPFIPVVGETYFIEWDGETYECEAKAVDTSLAGYSVYLGAVDEYPEVEMTGNGEPFCIMLSPAEVTGNTDCLDIVCTTETATSHTIRIYQKSASSVDIQPLEVTANGTYTAPDGVAYSPITVNVEGGGGSLEGGAYLKMLPFAAPNEYWQTGFEYNGDLYVIAEAAYSSSTYAQNIYKRNFETSAWELILTQNISQYMTTDGQVGVQVFDGLVHILDDSTKHWTFDGTTITAKATPPFTPNGACVAVWNNKLIAGHSSSFSTEYTLYEWDAETDTWTPFATQSYHLSAICVKNNKLFIMHTGGFFEYQDGEFIQYTGLANYSYPFPHLCNFDENRFFYKSKYTDYNKLYSYDVTTQEAKAWGVTPIGTGSPTLESYFSYNGKIHIIWGAPNTRVNICEVNLVEE